MRARLEKRGGGEESSSGAVWMGEPAFAGSQTGEGRAAPPPGSGPRAGSSSSERDALRGARGGAPLQTEEDLDGEGRIPVLN